MSLKEKIYQSFFKNEIERSVSLAVRAVDDSRDRLTSPRIAFTAQTTGGRDRFDHEREEILRQSLEAWRVNPLARRIVELTSQYVVGGGISIESRHPASRQFLREFWQDRLNRMDVRVIEWSDELCRSGELFILVSTDAGGMSYVRAIPALEIVDIETNENDIEQELRYFTKGERCYAGMEAGDGSGEGLDHVMLHYAVNRPAGALRGESDLAPLLRWLSRYAAWLEDRARLNHFRNLFQSSLPCTAVPRRTAAGGRRL